MSIGEYPLFTDACFIKGEILNENSPYQILNPDVFNGNNVIVMRLILRLEEYSVTQATAPTELNTPRISATESAPFDFYLEGNTPDQIAVILSLCLGIRIKAGTINRLFDTNGDNYGKPIAHMAHTNPSAVRLVGEHAVLPSALENIYDQKKKFSLDSAESYFSSFMQLNTEQATLLIRAAKLYRDALWLIESEPQLSWIMLVSAIEVVAKEHIKTDNDPVNIFRDKEEALATEVEKHGGTDLLLKIANLFVEKKWVGKKYLKFLIDFLPEPPSPRVPESMQIAWDKLKQNSGKNPLMTIYNYRSKALHSGTPFPLDMCYMPRLPGIPYELAEKPNSSLFIAKDGQSQKVEVGPMMLSLFEYIVRNSLLNWWKSCLKEKMNPSDDNKL